MSYHKLGKPYNPPQLSGTKGIINKVEGDATLMAKVLLIEQDEQMASRISNWLSLEQYSVESVAECKQALSALSHNKFDFIILDSQLADSCGREVCNYSRIRGGETPVLMLIHQSFRDRPYPNGADDYLKKPFHPRKLSMKLVALSH